MNAGNFYIKYAEQIIPKAHLEDPLKNDLKGINTEYEAKQDKQILQLNEKANCKIHQEKEIVPIKIDLRETNENKTTSVPAKIEVNANEQNIATNNSKTQSNLNLMKEIENLKKIKMEISSLSKEREPPKSTEQNSRNDIMSKTFNNEKKEILNEQISKVNAEKNVNVNNLNQSINIKNNNSKFENIIPDKTKESVENNEKDAKKEIQSSITQNESNLLMKRSSMAESTQAIKKPDKKNSQPLLPDTNTLISKETPNSTKLKDIEEKKVTQNPVSLPLNSIFKKPSVIETPMNLRTSGFYHPIVDNSQPIEDKNVIKNFGWMPSTKSTTSIATHFEDSESLMNAYNKRKKELAEYKQKFANSEAELKFSILNS